MNDDKADPFDLERLALPADFRVPEKRVILGRERRQLGQFTKFPNTWAWRLRKTRSAATWNLARYLLWRHWLLQRRGAEESSFTLSDGVCDRLGIARRGKYRALAELEEFGLIRVTKRIGKNPQVVLVFPQPDTHELCD